MTTSDVNSIMEREAHEPDGLLAGSPDPNRQLSAGQLAALIALTQRDDRPEGRFLSQALSELESRRRRGFGLVWDRESPDNAERLHIRIKNDSAGVGHALALGVIVDLVDDDESLFRVTGARLDRGWRYTLQPWEPRTGDLALDEIEVKRADISHVVHVPYDTSTTAYPVLRHVESIRHADCPVDAPVHTLIEGENFHALQALLATHRGKIDLIYIDPPYNTGNLDFAYNDRYISDTDDFRHSSWLRFMERRLRLAKQLLAPTGVIIVAIGDDEHHQLRLLLDQTMGVPNYLADVTWQGRVKNDRAFTGGGADFMLFYAKDRKVLEEAGTRWTERKLGVGELLAVARTAFVDALASSTDRAAAAASATKALRRWVTAHKNEYSGGVLSYRSVDEEGRVYQAGPLDSPNPRPNLTFDVFHPVTGQAIPTPKNGWRVSRELLEKMDADGLVLWGKDHTTGIRRKLTLTADSEGVPKPTFEADRDTATKQLRNMIGDTGFTNPKPHEVLANWIRMVTAPDATILDFFAGSGSTLHAVAQLNDEDGGTRRCILVTNNSANEGPRFVPDGGADGISQKVTIPRTRAVLETGYAQTAAILQRCEVFKIDYLHGRSLKDADADATTAIMPTLWLQSGLTGTLRRAAPDTAYIHFDLSFAVVPSSVSVAQFESQLEGRSPRLVWVLGNDPDRLALLVERLPNSDVRSQTSSYKRTIDETLRSML